MRSLRQAVQAGLMVVVLWGGGVPAVQAADAPAGGAATTSAALPRKQYGVKEAWEDLKRYYVEGGSTMHAILFLSVVSLAFILERAFRLRRGVVAPAGVTDEARKLWAAGKLDELRALAEKNKKSTLGKILLFILEYKEAPLAEINTAAGDIAARDKARHLMLTYPLGVCAVLAPLLGLFGTVVGMVEAFEIVALAGAMGDPALLSSSISKALLTTVFGLIVAIPGVFMFQLFKLRAGYLFNQLDEEGSVMINEWFLKKKGN